MSDRELLELAAKAAGMSGCAVEYGTRLVFLEDGKPASLEWSPLTDDGDALRLAVKLKIHTHTGFGTEVLDAPDPYAATRRAIVRAAAGIGRSMT